MEVALEQKRMARHNLLLDCKIQELPVALLSGDLTEINEVQVGPGGPGRTWRSRLCTCVFSNQFQWSWFTPSPKIPLETCRTNRILSPLFTASRCFVKPSTRLEGGH